MKRAIYLLAYSLHIRIQLHCNSRQYCAPSIPLLIWLHQSFFQNSKLQYLKIAPIWGIFLVVLRDLAKKVGRVQIFGWEFLAELRQCYSLVISTLQGYLRQFFYGNGRSAFYTPARRKSRGEILKKYEF